MTIHRETYDLITAQLRRGDDGLELSDRGLVALAEKLAGLAGDARAEALLGLLAALDYVNGQGESQPAAATLLGVFLSVLEQTHLADDQREAFLGRMRSLTGQAERKLPSNERPEGTVPAGPGARFQMGGQLPKRGKK